MQPLISSFGSSYSYRVCPMELTQRLSLQQLRRADRLTMKLSEMAATAENGGDRKTANQFRRHNTRIRRDVCLPVFTA